MLLGAVAAAAAGGAPCRDRTQWPFASWSVWNTPIGSGAQFSAAGLYGGPSEPPDPGDCAAPTADPSSRVQCPGVGGGVTAAQCAAKGCCFDASPSPDPHGYPWCFARRHRSGPQHFHTDGDGFFVTSASVNYNYNQLILIYYLS